MPEPFSIDPDDLEGSALGEALKNANVVVAPLLGVEFCEPWVIPDA